eukprot:115863_1
MAQFSRLNDIKHIKIPTNCSMPSLFYDINLNPITLEKRWYNHPTLNEIVEIVKNTMDINISLLYVHKSRSKGRISMQYLRRTQLSLNEITKGLLVGSGQFCGKLELSAKFFREDFVLKYWEYEIDIVGDKAKIAVEAGPIFALYLWGKKNICVVQLSNSYNIYYCNQTDDKIIIWDYMDMNNYFIHFTPKYVIKVPKSVVIVLAGKAKVLYSNYNFRKSKTNIPWKAKSEKKGNKICDNCGESDALQMCSACQKVYYCSKKCQKIGWKKMHRHDCIAKYIPHVFTFPNSGPGEYIVII